MAAMASSILVHHQQHLGLPSSSPYSSYSPVVSPRSHASSRLRPRSSYCSIRSSELFGSCLDAGPNIQPGSMSAVAVTVCRVSSNYRQCSPFHLIPQNRPRNVAAQAWWSSKKNTSPESMQGEEPKPNEASKKSTPGPKAAPKQANGTINKKGAAPVVPAVPVEEEEEVEITWVQEKAEELVQLTGNTIKSIPGPRVGESSMPWLLALPIAYFSITFVIAVYRTIRKYNSPKSKKRRMIGKNAFLVTSLDKYFPQRRLEFDHKKLKELEKKCAFDTKEILRKYIRYVLNERPFNPDVVADLIHLRKVTKLEDEDVAEVLNETSRRIIKEKGTVMMNLQGLTERGVKRKAAVQSLFSKLLYLSELDEFCSTSRASLKIKEVFGVTDEDANSIRIETLSELSDIESLEKMVDRDEETTNPDTSEPSTQ